MCYFIFASEMSPRKQFQLRHPIGGVVASPLFAAKHPVTKMLATTARAMVIITWSSCKVTAARRVFLPESYCLSLKQHDHLSGVPVC